MLCNYILFYLAKISSHISQTWKNGKYIYSPESTHKAPSRFHFEILKTLTITKI